MSRKLLIGLFGFGLIAAAPSAQAAMETRPKLIVAISVDQFSYELFQRYRPTFTGGLKRLSDGRAFMGYQSHAATETCPGHSTILTGAHPARTGIVANSWYDRKTGASVYCVSVPGVADSGASGSALLRVDALGDWTKSQKPGSQSFAVSGKDRAAIMMAGHHPDGVYWWNDGAGFATSRYAGPMTPAVLEPATAFNSETLQSWRSTPPQVWPAEISARCKALEKPYTFGQRASSGALPPELLKAAENSRKFLTGSAFANALHVSPLYDSLALAFAARLIDVHRLGQGKGADVLAVSLSATDYIGHLYGSGGAEMCVQMAALDQALGAFLERLDKIGAPYAVVLTADHGGVDAPERLGPPARRIDIAALVTELNSYLRSQFSLTTDPVVGDDPRQIILNLAAAAEAQRPAVRDKAMAWLKARPEVAAAYSAAEIVHSAPPAGKAVADLTLAERFYESYDPERSGDILVAYAERSTLGIPRTSDDSVAGHGSPWDYDRRVPILFWWPGV